MDVKLIVSIENLVEIIDCLDSYECEYGPKNYVLLNQLIDYYNLIKPIEDGE
jgi:hypothetical protein